MRRLLAMKVSGARALAIAVAGLAFQSSAADLSTSMAATSPAGITKAVADGDYVNITGDTMTGLLTTTSLTCSLCVFTSSVADGTVGFIFNVENEHATGNLFEFREAGGAAYFRANASGAVLIDKGIAAIAHIRNDFGTTTLCAVSSSGVCIVDAGGLDINADIIDSRTNSPTTFADVDGVAITAGDLALSSVDITCGVANACSLGSIAERFNSVFASDLFSDRINARGVGDKVKIVEPDGLEVTGPTTFLASLTTTGTDPGLSACGTSPTVVGSDTAGKVTIGTSGPSVTSCTVTFATAFANDPACTVSGDDAGETYATTTTTTVLTILAGTDMDSDVISYFCVGL